MIKTKKITLRKAEINDCKKIFFLFNDPEVRKNSLNQNKIDYKKHKEWFSKKIIDRNYLILIAESAGVFVGQVRFDINGNEALTSVSLHKYFRGYGLGKILLADGLKYLKRHRQDITYALGQIKPDNIAAIKNSAYAGFRFDKKLSINGHMINQYKSKLK
jgi:ribosomal protein S18 acetylase RimI-like enzyme